MCENLFQSAVAPSCSYGVFVGLSLVFFFFLSCCWADGLFWLSFKLSWRFCFLLLLKLVVIWRFSLVLAAPSYCLQFFFINENFLSFQKKLAISYGRQQQKQKEGKKRCNNVVRIIIFILFNYCNYKCFYCKKQ